jgi:hypothetical protein
MSQPISEELWKHFYKPGVKYLNNGSRKAAFCQTCIDAKVTAIQTEQEQLFRSVSNDAQPHPAPQDEDTIRNTRVSHYFDTYKFCALIKYLC